MFESCEIIDSCILNERSGRAASRETGPTLSAVRLLNVQGSIRAKGFCNGAQLAHVFRQDAPPSITRHNSCRELALRSKYARIEGPTISDRPGQR